MDQQNSIFDLVDKFSNGYAGPFDNWISEIEIKRWEEAQLRKQKGVTFYHYAFEDEQTHCAHVNVGIYLKTKKIDEVDLNKQRNNHIVGFPYPPNNNRIVQEPSTFEFFFKPESKCTYIEHWEHLKEDGSLKQNGFWIKLKGAAYNSNQKYLGLKELYIHEDCVERSPQFNLYYDLDKKMTEFNKNENNWDEEHHTQAKLIYNKIALEKAFNKIFDFDKLVENKQRLFFERKIVEAGDPPKTKIQKINPKIGLGLDVKNGATFSVSVNLTKEDYDKIEETYGLNHISKVFIFNPKINMPYYSEVINKIIPGTKGQVTSEFNKPYPNFYDFNRLEIMMAHEYIHAMQNCLDPISQTVRNIGALNEDKNKEGEKELRKNQRELYAHHFNIFPNRKYVNPNEDPVFKYTNFKRGESAIFGGVKESQSAHWVWMAYKYISYLNKRMNKISGSDKNDIEKCIEEILIVKECYENKGYEFPDHTGDYDKDKTVFREVNKELWGTDSPDFQNNENQQEEENK